MVDEGGPDLVRTAFGIVGAHAVGALARMGVLDVLDDQGTTTADAAARLGLHEDRLLRLLRVSAAMQAVAEVAPGRFAPTAAGRELRRDHPSGMYALVALISDPVFARSLPQLEHQLHTGELGFDTAFGEPFFAHLGGHPDESAEFTTAMHAWTHRTTGALPATGGFDRFGTLVDVGGGDGSLMAAVLAAHPSLRGIVFDTPEGAARAPATLAASGLDDRCTVETGDFFVSVPAGGDAYLLKNIVHDWDDEKAATILRHCRDALPERGRVLLVELVLPDTVEAGSPTLPYLFDVAMLVTVGGRERTLGQFEALFRAAGLEPAGVTDLPGETGYRVVEAVRAG